jgi:hypothetical protein
MDNETSTTEGERKRRDFQHESWRRSKKSTQRRRQRQTRMKNSRGDGRTVTAPQQRDAKSSGEDERSPIGRRFPACSKGWHIASRSGSRVGPAASSTADEVGRSCRGEIVAPPPCDGTATAATSNTRSATE